MEVVTAAGIVAALAKAERKLEGALALVSGRAIEDLDRLFEPLRLRASAVHGAQMRFDPGEPAAPSPGVVELPASLWVALTRAVDAFPGASAESKRFSFAVHFRLAQGLEKPLRETVMRLINSQPQTAIEIFKANYAFELKAPGFDKGNAIATFLSCPRFRGRTPIFVGDDEPDEAGFAVVPTRSFAFSVGRPRPRAFDAFARPCEVRQWLADFAECGGGT